MSEFAWYPHNKTEQKFTFAKYFFGGCVIALVFFSDFFPLDLTEIISKRFARSTL